MDARSSGYRRERTAAHERSHANPVKPPGRARLRRQVLGLAQRLDTLIRPDAADAGGPNAARRVGLLGYTAASIVSGLALFVWTTTSVPVQSAIDPGLDGTALAGSTGGLLLWILFGFIGSLRVLRAPGGAGVLTFHLPFIGAAMVLGGPTAGAWVAFLSTLERRELEEVPWYGILANHSVFVIASVAGGLAAQAISGLAAGAGSPGLPTALAAVGGMLVLTLVSTGMAGITVMIRDEYSFAEYREILTGQFGRVNALEVAIAWVLVVAYLQIGWWAPVVVGAMVLLVWDNHPMPAPDALTGLLEADGFTRRLDAGLGRLRRGLVPGGTLMSIDLDRFKAANDNYGHAVGDEVLARVGTCLRAQARRPADMAGRMGGDEFTLFLPGLGDPAVAMRRAVEVVAAVSAPIATTAGSVSVGASVGVVVLAAGGSVPAAGTVLRHADLAMFIAKRAGGGAHLYDPSEPGPFDDGWVDERR